MRIALFKMDNETEFEHLQKNIYILQLSGIWPDEKRGKLIKNLSKIYMILITIFFTFGVVAETLRELRGFRDDINSLLTCLLSLGIVSATVVFVLAFYIKRKHILQIKEKLKLLESHFKPSNLIETEKQIRKFTTILFYYTNITDALYTFIPFVQYNSCLETQKTAVHLKHVPCGVWTPMWYPFDYTYSPVYELMIFISLCYTYVFSFNSIGLCTLNIGVTFHLINHLRNLKKQLRIALEDEKSLKLLKKCIRYHIEIIKFSDYLNNCFSLYNLVITIISTYIIGVLECQIILMNENLFESFRYAFHLWVWVMVLFFLNLIAQLLWDESRGDELYNIKWEDCPTTVQKDVLFMLKRCAIPLTSNTGPFGVMRNETFLWIVKTAYTFFAVFSNVRNQ